MAFSVSLCKIAASTVELKFPLVQQFPFTTSRNFLPPVCCVPLQQQVQAKISKTKSVLEDVNKSFLSIISHNKMYSFKRLDMHAVKVDSGIMCETCSGRGWLICDFCEGQKTNVRSEKNRIYRRCPSCRAVGYILCSKCKVFKCVTFPDNNDGLEIIL